MTNLDRTTPPKRRYPIFARLVGVLILIGIAVGNIMLFMSPVDNFWNWEQTFFVVFIILALAFTVWLISQILTKIYKPQFSKLQSTVIMAFMFILIFGASTFIVIKMKYL